jgi:hypothetical protein
VEVFPKLTFCLLYRCASTANDTEKVTRLLPADRFWSTSKKISFFLERLYVAASNMPLSGEILYVSRSVHLNKNLLPRKKSRKCKNAPKLLGIPAV